jgi:hypothetical protein
VELVFAKEVAVLAGAVGGRAEFVLKLVRGPPFGIASIPLFKKSKRLAMRKQETADKDAGA